VLRLDAPDLFSGRMRLDTRVSFQRTINAGYYGIGNAASTDVSSDYLQEEGRVRVIGRMHTGVSGIDGAIAANLRYETPSVYTRSKLAEDLAGAQPGLPVPVGAENAFLTGLAAGVMYDTRDSEFVTRRGVFYQLGLGATVGSAERVGYGEAAAVLSHYAPLVGPFLFASRFVLSFQFGRVPFYDLAQGGVFEPQYLIGGETGVRGVPQGRYVGRVKVASNIEVRSLPFPRFKLFGSQFRIGTTTFFDAGRVWSDYAVISRADGSTFGLKYGIGGGIFLQWGEAAIFRIEAAYSPDAVSENPQLPLGIYVSDGLMF
jgi:outer membrane protein assembly factor BamA